MKKFLALVVFTSFSFISFSQDLILTNEGDSINCKITKVGKDNIYFTFKHKDEIRSTLLPLSQVNYHQFEFYRKSEVPAEKVIGRENYPHFRAAINGGYSYETAKISESVPADFIDYTKSLKSGYHLSGDLTYYFSEPIGFGVKYTTFKSSNSLDNIYIEDNEGNREYGVMSDDLSISFIGPTFATRLLNGKKRNAFLMNLSIGYVGYSNNKVIIDSYKITGSTVGLAFDLGYDIGLSKNLLLGFQLSLLTGTLSEYKLNNGAITETVELQQGEYEGLGRIDLSIGLRFSK